MKFFKDLFCALAALLCPNYYLDQIQEGQSDDYTI
jgi:hypothetical protein